MIWKELSQIPGFLINEFGEILWEGKLRGQYLNEDGYLRSSVKTLRKGWITIPVQRLTAAAWIDEEYLFVESMQVNHRDLDKFNNHYSNLEWVTNEENNLHAALFREQSNRKCIKVTCKESYSLFFYTVYDCAEHFKIHPLDIWDSIRFCKDFNGLKFEYFKRGDRKPVELFKIPATKRDFNSGKFSERKIKVKDITTGEIRYFDSLAECEKRTGIKKSSLAFSLGMKGKISLISRRFQVVYSENDFIEIADSKSLKGKLSVISFNLITKEEEIFESAAAFYKSKFLSKKSVTVTLSKRNIRNTGNYLYCYLRENKLVEEIRNHVASL